MHTKRISWWHQIKLRWHFPTANFRRNGQSVVLGACVINHSELSLSVEILKMISCSSLTFGYPAKKKTTHAYRREKETHRRTNYRGKIKGPYDYIHVPRRRWWRTTIQLDVVSAYDDAESCITIVWSLTFGGWSHDYLARDRRWTSKQQEWASCDLVHDFGIDARDQL